MNGIQEVSGSIPLISTRTEKSLGTSASKAFLVTRIKLDRVGPVAQLGERSVRIREVESSNLFRSTSFEIPAAVLFPVFPEAARWREFPRFRPGMEPGCAFRPGHFRPLFFLVMFDGTGFPYGLSWQNAGKIAAFYQGPPVSHQNLAENGPL